MGFLIQQQQHRQYELYPLKMKTACVWRWSTAPQFSLLIPIYLYIFTSPRGNSQGWASHIYGFICFCNFQWMSISFALLGGSFHRLRKSCTFTHCYWTSHMLLSRHRQTFWFEYFYLRGKSLFWLDECSSLVGLIVICKICAYTMCIIIIIIIIRTLKLHFM